MRCWCVCAVWVIPGALLAQAPPTGPVVSPRGVVNAVTQQPAPSVVAQGGIVSITGLNLGPPEGAKAAGAPLPTQLGDPPVEVLIHGKPAPLFSASPERIVAQVPWEAEAGLAEVVVRRSGAESRPARIQIVGTDPSVRTADENGYGEVAGTLTGNTLAISATGLGQSQPRVGSGEAGPQDPPARPRALLEAYVGGLPANLGATLSKERVGEFDIRIEVPVGARPGDAITLLVRARAGAAAQAANPATFQKLSKAEVQFVPVPRGAPEFRSLATSELNGNYLIASGARDDNGCYPSYVFDVANKQASKIDNCLTIGNKNAPSPIVPARDGAALAALVGPPQGELPAGVASKVQIFNPGKDSVVVDLPAAASTLAAGPGGDYQALIPGTPPRLVTVDSETGEVREAGAAPGGGGGGVLSAAGGSVPKIDLGDGLTQVLGMLQLPQNLIAVIVGDDADQPKKAKVAVVNGKGEVQGSTDFPDGWTPLMAPRAPQGSAQPGADRNVLAAAAALRRLSVNFDAENRVFYLLAKVNDNSKHGLIVFATEDAAPRVMAFPDAWFAAACSPTIPVFSLELSRKLAFLGSNVAETEVKDPCPGSGFILLDLDKQTALAVPLASQAQFDADPATSGDINDYIFGVDTDPSRRNTANTLFVLDGVNASAFQMSLPTGITSFGNLGAVKEMNALIGMGLNRVAGDAGFVVFDLERAEARSLPVPEGFARVEMTGIFTTTRKLVARGIKSGGAASQYLIYDLVSGDLQMPDNPSGVVAVGGITQQAGQGGGATPAPGGTTPPPGGTPATPQAPTVLQRANPRANTVAALAYSRDGRQAGVLVLRVP